MRRVLRWKREDRFKNSSFTFSSLVFRFSSSWMSSLHFNDAWEHALRSVLFQSALQNTALVPALFFQNVFFFFTANLVIFDKIELFRDLEVEVL